IFSFGAILYEMLSGRRAFHGESAAETMSAILREDPPDLSETNQRISPALERLVNRCLEKNPQGRFHSASDLAFALDALSGGASIFDGTAEIKVPPFHSRKRERWIWITATGLLLMAVIGLAFLYLRRIPQEAATTRFLIMPTDSTSFSDSVVSPDGRTLAINGRDSSRKSLLWIRSLDSVTMQPLVGTDGALYPFWSPDGRSIAFFASGKLKRIEVSGGPAQTLCDTGSGAGGTWNRDGVIVFSPENASSLYRISASGGIQSQITTLDQTRMDVSHKYPQFLPDGNHYL